MKFKESKYYNKEFLGECLYKHIYNLDKILTVHEFFNLSNGQKEYQIKDQEKDYKLKIYDNYYEFSCQSHDILNPLYLVFDKPVHITGKHCSFIIAPEILVENSENKILSRCIANKLMVNNNNKNYFVNLSKVINVYFCSSNIKFWNCEINNFFIFNRKLKFDIESCFLDYHKIKVLGKCADLKEKLLKYEDFKKEIIHIE